MSENKMPLTVNCDKAFLIRDGGGILDSLERLVLNCDTYVATREIAARLAAMGSMVNCDTSMVIDMPDHVLTLEHNAIVSGPVDYGQAYLLAKGNLAFTGDGWKSLESAAGMVVGGTLYYPREADPACISKVMGEKHAYPGEAWFIPGDCELSKALRLVEEGRRQIYITGKLTALQEADLQEARDRDIRLISGRLLTHEGLYGRFQPILETSDITLIPDGHEIVPESHLTPGFSVLYGKRCYISGDLILEETGEGELKELESLVVKGCASIPSSLAASFRKIGRADSYFLYEGKLLAFNGSNTIGHKQLQSVLEQGSRITIRSNGHLSFDQDVTYEDTRAIAALYFNGVVLAPDAARAGLSECTRQANGVMGSPEDVDQLGELSFSSGTNLKGILEGNIVNADCYLLL